MEFQNYINGKWVEGRTKFQTINPANEELLAEIAQAEIGAACLPHGTGDKPDDDATYGDD